MADFLKKLFGTKSDRDMKELNPIVDGIQKVYEQIALLSNDELRAKTASFKQQIADATQEEIAEMERMEAEMLPTEPTPEERIAELEKTNAMLLEALLEMSEEVYG